MPRDYFSLETIRDKDKNIVCYFITVIGTIEHDGVPHLRVDLGEEGDKKMAFGKITLHNLDRTISHLLANTGCRIFSHDVDALGQSVDTISFSARDWRADEICTLEEGDRVMIEGRGYIRKPDEEHAGSRSEMRITVSGMFLLAKPRVRRVDPHRSLIPQDGI